MSNYMKVAEIRALPGPVSERVMSLRAVRTRRITFERVMARIHEPHTDTYWTSKYLEEGGRYDFYYKGEWRHLSMMSQEWLHAGGNPLEHQIGFHAFPAGTWIVEVSLFLGQYYIHVYEICLPEEATLCATTSPALTRASI